MCRHRTNYSLYFLFFYFLLIVRARIFFRFAKFNTTVSTKKNHDFVLTWIFFYMRCWQNIWVYAMYRNIKKYIYFLFRLLNWTWSFLLLQRGLQTLYLQTNTNKITCLFEQQIQYTVNARLFILYTKKNYDFVVYVFLLGLKPRTTKNCKKASFISRESLKV